MSDVGRFGIGAVHPGLGLTSISEIVTIVSLVGYYDSVNTPSIYGK